MHRKVIFFTKYTESGPSSRYRSYQYFPYLEKAGYEIVTKPLFPSTYVDKLYQSHKKSLLIIFSSYLKRFWQLLFIKNHSLLFVEYELFPFIPIFIERLFLKGKRNVVIDYDDAVFHHYDKSNNPFIKFLLEKKIPDIMGMAAHIITGNRYLTDFALKFNSSVTEIPTSIIYERYQNLAEHQNDPFFKIGWIGVPSNSINLLNILPALEQFAKGKKVRLILVGFNKSLVEAFNGLDVEVREWSQATETADIRSFTVGIMPLVNTPFNNGKCAFKVVQYMACGLPTISTPLPANIQINKRGENLLASTLDEWITALEAMYDNQSYFCRTVGENNKLIVKEYYSVESNSKKLVGILNNLNN